MTHFKTSLKAAQDILKRIADLEDRTVHAADIVFQALMAGNKILLCGNGGSSADCAHIATEFVCRFKEDRRGYPAIALGVDGGLLTAISNDYAFQDVFARQVQALGKPGDVLIVLSTSGKSRNILEALEEARRSGLETIALLGKGGGFTAGAAETELIIPGTETARIQEAQKFLLHVLCELVEERLPRE